VRDGSRRRRSEGQEQKEKPGTRAEEEVRDRSRRRSEGQGKQELLLTLPGIHVSRQPTATWLAERRRMGMIDNRRRYQGPGKKKREYGVRMVPEWYQMRSWCYSLGLMDVSVAGGLQHAGPDALVIDPVGHSSNHVWQQRCGAMDEFAELVHLQNRQ